MMGAMTAPLEVFADVRCPFTHVGVRRLIESRRALGADRPRLWVRAWPLELVNGEPLVASVIATEVDALRQGVAPDLFRGFDAATFATSSLPALTLAAAAYRSGHAVGEAVSLGLRDALFELGRDISDPTVLASIAARNGGVRPTSDDERQVLDDWHEGRRRGVIGSPHFFVQGEGYFCPSLTITHAQGELRITSDDAALHDFVHRALAQ
jgi:predicted DsbA family dithiol-disulfide isomerase